MIVISDKLTFSSKRDIILIHLYVKSKQFKIDLSEGVMSLLYYMYEIGGISKEADLIELSKLCIANTTIQTLNSVRNTISKCVAIGVIKNNGKYNKQIASEWLPSETSDVIGLDYKMMNVNAV